MKKYYQRPESMVMTIEVCSLMDVSNPNVTVNTTDTDGIDASDVESRGSYSDWDD